MLGRDFNPIYHAYCANTLPSQILSLTLISPTFFVTLIKPYLVTLFSGAGLSFNLVQAMDINTNANKVYKHNFPEVKIEDSAIEVSQILLVIPANFSIKLPHELDLKSQGMLLLLIQMLVFKLKSPKRCDMPQNIAHNCLYDAAYPKGL